MKIIINTKNTIPVEIGKLNYEISTSDENIERLSKEMEECKRKLSGLTVATIEDAREGLKEIFDVMLGEGVGEEIYKEYPSVITLSDIAKQLLNAWSEELEALAKGNGQTVLAKEYLKKKK